MNSKLLIGLGAVAAVVLLGVFVVSPLLFDDDGVDEPIDAAAAADADADDADDAGTADDEGAADDTDDAADDPDPVDETFEVFTARDPFQQLVSDGGQATPVSTDSGDGGDGGSGGIASVDEDDDDDGDGDGDGDGGGGDSSSDASVGGTTVELIEVFEDTDGTDTVHVTVNGTGYEVTEGDDFAGRFRVLDVSGRCATFLFGDQRFTLCEGETIRK